MRILRALAPNVEARTLVFPSLSRRNVRRKEYDRFQCRLRFCDFQSIDIPWDSGTGTSEAQTTRGVFATQKGITASCRSAAGHSKATGTERIPSVGVINIISTSLHRGHGR